MDTLVRPCVNGEDITNIAEIEGYRNLKGIHGINKEWLEDAPQFESVRSHIFDLIYGKFNTVEKICTSENDENRNDENHVR